MLKIITAAAAAASVAGFTSIMMEPAKDQSKLIHGVSPTVHAGSAWRKGQLQVVLYDESAQKTLGPMSRREAEAWKSAYPNAEILVPDEEGRYHAQGWLSFDQRYRAAELQFR